MHAHAYTLYMYMYINCSFNSFNDQFPQLQSAMYMVYRHVLYMYIWWAFIIIHIFKFLDVHLVSESSQSFPAGMLNHL